MSKLLTMYNNLKKQNSETIYLFKLGLFYNFLNDDALTISNLINLKVSNLSPSIIKCGFPTNSLEKYISLLSKYNFKIKIIDFSKENLVYNINEYKLDKNIISFCNKILKIDTDSLSVSEAYSILDDLKAEAKKILENC